MENSAQMVNVFYTLYFFILGGLIGSFSNVIILRMATGTSIVFPPSSCPKCGHRLGFFDLFPVFSWIFLRGKCRYCKAPISIQYPLVESAIAAIVGFTYVHYGLDLNFIALSSAFVIWFIASVIFFRNEVKSPAPFLWCVMYFIGLAWICGYTDAITPSRLLGIIACSCVVGSIASSDKNQVEAISFGTLSFITFLSITASGFNFIHCGFASLIAAFLSKSDKTEKAGRIAFFSLQVLTIIAIFINR